MTVALIKAAALDYADRLGWAMFPVAPDCRRPLVEGGCYAATADPRHLEGYFSRPANLALACGAASGVFVLDVDIKHDATGRRTIDGLQTLAELEDQHGRLPDTWQSITPSGGTHLFFRQPDRKLRNRVNFATGLDIRTDGGSVALPPSEKDIARPGGHGRTYKWEAEPGSVPLADAPDWLLEMIDPPQPPRPPVPPLRMGNVDRAARYVAAAVNGECAAIASTPPNAGRNMRLFIASARLGELVGGGLLAEDMACSALERAAFDCGLTKEDGPHQVGATIKSGLRRGFANPRQMEVRA